MPSNLARLYHWLGINQHGRRLTGSEVAFSLPQAHQLLQEKQIRPLKVIARPLPWLMRRKHGITHKQITALTYQLAIMLQAGLPLNHAIDELSRSTRQRELHAMLHQIHAHITQGRPLSQAMADFACFDALFVQFVRVGESNGELAYTLRLCAEQREKNSKLSKQIRSAMIYPVIVVISAIIVFLIMMLFVVPEFSGMFTSFGAELPAMTQATLALSQWLTAQFHWWLLTLLILIMSLKTSFRRSPGMQDKLAHYLLKCPVIGRCILYGELARFNHLFALGIHSGLPLLTCLTNAAGCINNSHLRARFLSVIPLIQAGGSLHSALSQIAWLPPLMLKLLKIGEHSGKLAELSNKVSEIFEEELAEISNNISAYLEPLIILLLGVVVGGIVLSMYLPIFSLMTAVG